jgi:glycosyltransferase involved in cell wall biosynthesis
MLTPSDDPRDVSHFSPVARIAIVHDIAGVAKVQARLLRSAGHDVDEISLPRTGASWRWPFKALALVIRVLAYLPAAGRLRGGRYDVVHIHWLPVGIVGVMAGVTFHVQAHGSDLHSNLRNPILRWVTRLVLRRAKSVFYVTPNLLAYLKGFESKARPLPNPVEPGEVAPESLPPEGVSNVVIFTRLDPVKGVDRIFPAVAELAGTVKLSALDWGPLAVEYEKRYGGQVHFVDTVPHEQIGAFLLQFDLVIGQMLQGILSLMELEAMAAGRPLITGVDWDLYKEDRPPVLRAAGPGEIVTAVKSLTADRSELTRLSREGREWVGRNHGYAHHLQLLEASYFAR